MSAALLDDLLASFLAPAGDAHAGPTPAKAAKAANHEHPCGLAPHSRTCEGLRISAKVEQTAPGADPDSQIFAAVRNPQTGPQGKQTYGSSQDSQNSQGCPPTYATGTAWTDGDIARFLDRRARLLRWGWAEAEAEKLAERLAVRDRERDGRRMCLECAHLQRAGGWRCGQWKQAGIGGAALPADLVQLLQRCEGFGATSTREMREQCLALPAHLQADLLGHFKGTKQ